MPYCFSWWGLEWPGFILLMGQAGLTAHALRQRWKPGNPWLAATCHDHSIRIWRRCAFSWIARYVPVLHDLINATLLVLIDHEVGQDCGARCYPPAEPGPKA